ncbi:hypothetical protein DPMN_094025 [Dreissena polymorpha]|uniref:Uncharacterized protein n=1 Tax=Dreissena polymorpha TaxID=45954 RepID=A0A9D4L4C6_DREPO|nr:hypothetical protein DPMN_094025 [Dreissena polymorpha]
MTIAVTDQSEIRNNGPSGEHSHPEDITNGVQDNATSDRDTSGQNTSDTETQSQKTHQQYQTISRH